MAKKLLNVTGLEHLLSLIKTRFIQLDAAKVDKIIGKGLSTNDFTNEEKIKLSTAEENVINGVQLNGVDVTITNKNVNIQPTIADITGLQTELNSKVDTNGVVTGINSDTVGLYLEADNNFYVEEKGTAEEQISLHNSDTTSHADLRDGVDNSIKALSASGKYITYTKNDETTGTIVTQDTTYNNATTVVPGLMSVADKTKLNSVESNANNYILPIASETTLGGVKIGNNLEIDNAGVLSATSDPVLLYETTGYNTDGAMTQKATTQAFDSRPRFTDLADVATSGSFADISDVQPFTLQGNGTSIGTYDGSTATTINLIPSSIGAGDMAKAVYDTDDNGKVDDADKLGGELPAYYGTATDIAAKAVKAAYTATISTTWIGSAAPYTQDVAIADLLATDAPHITPVYSDTLATALLEKEAWGMISEADAGAGKITFTCFEDKPTTAVNIQVEVVR